MTMNQSHDPDFESYITDTLQGFMEALEILESDLPVEFYERVIEAGRMDVDSLRLKVGSTAKQLKNLITLLKGAHLLKCHYLVCALRLTIKDRQISDEAFQRLAKEIYALAELIRREQVTDELDLDLEEETTKH